MAKDSEDENPDPAEKGKRMKPKNPDHHHHTILKTKFQKMIHLQLMLKTKHVSSFWNCSEIRMDAAKN